MERDLFASPPAFSSANERRLSVVKGGRLSSDAEFVQFLSVDPATPGMAIMRVLFFVATLCAVGVVLVFHRASLSSRVAKVQAANEQPAQPSHPETVSAYKGSSAGHTAAEHPRDAAGNQVKTAGPQLLDAYPIAMQSGGDVRLAAEIRTALLKDSKVSSVSDGVTILVRGAMVTLQGRVNDLEQKRAVESDTRSVSGVEQVDNLLVTPGN
jgi:BON domain